MKMKPLMSRSISTTLELIIGNGNFSSPKTKLKSNSFSSSSGFLKSPATNHSTNTVSPACSVAPPPPLVAAAASFPSSKEAEENVEKVIYMCRFMALLGVWGSLVGSILCFVKGCVYVAVSFMEYFVDRGKVIMGLVEAIDVYLLGTVMLVFGMGLYELFISNLDIVPQRSSLFGLFPLKERPKWLEIKSVNELKTKLGHVIVMLLLIGLLDKSKKAAINSSFDLLCFSASVLLSAGCLLLLSRLNGSK